MSQQVFEPATQGHDGMHLWACTERGGRDSKRVQRGGLRLAAPVADDLVRVLIAEPT
jgi:hypothetical protein